MEMKFLFRGDYRHLEEIPEIAAHFKCESLLMTWGHSCISGTFLGTGAGAANNRIVFCSVYSRAGPRKQVLTMWFPNPQPVPLRSGGRAHGAPCGASSLPPRGRPAPPAPPEPGAARPLGSGPARGSRVDRRGAQLVPRLVRTWLLSSETVKLGGAWTDRVLLHGPRLSPQAALLLADRIKLISRILFYFFTKVTFLFCVHT